MHRADTAFPTCYFNVSALNSFSVIKALMQFFISLLDVFLHFLENVRPDLKLNNSFKVIKLKQYVFGKFFETPIQFFISVFQTYTVIVTLLRHSSQPFASYQMLMFEHPRHE